MLEEYFDERTTLQDIQSLNLSQLMLMVSPRHRRYVFTLEQRLRQDVQGYLSLASSLKPAKLNLNTSFQDVFPALNPAVVTAATVLDLRNNNLLDEQDLSQLASALRCMPNLQYVRLEMNRLEGTTATVSALEAVLDATAAVVAIAHNSLASIQAKSILFCSLPHPKLLRLIWISRPHLSGRFWHNLLDTRGDFGDELKRDVVALHLGYYARAERWDTKEYEQDVW